MGKLNSLNYRNVELADSHWKKQRDELIETYLGIKDEDMLHWFYQKAGLPDKANGLEGWYALDADVFGQILGALAKLYVATGDERLKTKALNLAEGFRMCFEKDNAIADSTGTYVYDKLMGGFCDMYEYLGYAPAVAILRKLTKSAAQRFDREVPRDGLQTMPGNMIEWYTLPEQIYRAYVLTGEKQYLDFARVWDYPYFWDHLLAHDTASIGPRHAYSHVNSLCSAARAYEVTGDETYLTAAEEGYKQILREYTFATGGYGPAECLFPAEEGLLGDSLKPGWADDRIHETYMDFGGNRRSRDDRWGSCEVSCCSWAVFKLTGYLLRATGKALYGAWAEKLLYNGTGGQLPVTSEGKVMYYAGYFENGSFKTTEDARLQWNGANFEWQCCTGTFPQDLAEYTNLLYYMGHDGLYVSQYLPGRVKFEAPDKKTAVLENLSQFPKEKEIRFVLHLEKPGEFCLSFRVPSWAGEKSSILINNCEVQAALKPDSWEKLSRLWMDGDTITIRFEWTLAFSSVDPFTPDLAALTFGPLTMVCTKMSRFYGDMQDPGSWLEPINTPGYSFSFRTKPGHVLPSMHLTRIFVPYYEVPAMTWYYMYNRVKNTSEASPILLK